MIPLARLAGATVSLMVAACETTGDPTQGGLFGWSENEARQRQAALDTRVRKAEADLAEEDRRGAQLAARSSDTDRRLSATHDHLRQSEQELRTQQIALLEKCDRLEAASPTAATASRARALRRKVNTVAANASLTTRQRADRLREIEAEIDAAQASLTR